MVNPNDLDAPSLCCAAETEEDYMMWMSSLTSVIDRPRETDEQGTSTEIEAYAEGVSLAI